MLLLFSRDGVSAGGGKLESNPPSPWVGQTMVINAKVPRGYLLPRGTSGRV